ncbi:MAG: glycosyltransferase family 2 protein, partial [Thermodesulfobacteriota bacterium]
MIYIILPAYNEEHKIASVMKDIDATLASAGVGRDGYRILLVNDGSTDDTLGAARAVQGVLPIDIIDHGVNRGVHEGFRSGFNAALALASDDDIIFTMDADGTHDVSRTPEMIDRIREGWDIVIASRLRPGAKIIGVPLYRNVLTYGASFFVKLLFRTPGARDFSIFHRAYRASALRELMGAYGQRFIEAEGFTSNAEVLIKAYRYFGPHARICEVPCTLRYEMKAGPSKMKVLENILGYLTMAWRVKFGPVPARMKASRPARSSRP